jgi:hypothetical protein
MEYLFHFQPLVTVLNHILSSLIDETHEYFCTCSMDHSRAADGATKIYATIAKRPKFIFFFKLPTAEEIKISFKQYV